MWSHSHCSLTQMDGTCHSVVDHNQRDRAHHSSISPSRPPSRLARRCKTTSCRRLLSCMGRLRALCTILLIYVRTFYAYVCICSSPDSLEAFARICVSGFLLDPEVPVSTLFQSPFSSYPDITRPPNTAADASFNLARTPSTHSHSQPGLHRGLTLTQRLRNLRANIARPFVLSQTVTTPLPSASDNGGKGTPSRSRSDTVQSKSPMMEKAVAGAQNVHSHMRNPSEPTFLSKALRSDNPSETLSLPWRLSVEDSRSQTQRNLPYLRHSWTRIDFIAIMSFWIAFALASAGVERNEYHIGLFRAMSVLRTARLLAITSGTTVR